MRAPGLDRWMPTMYNDPANNGMAAALITAWLPRLAAQILSPDARAAGS